MPRHDVIVVGASAGGVEAIMDLVQSLPPDLAAAVFVVLHMPASSPSHLPAILARNSALRAVAADGERIRYGTIYVAPPDRHLLVEHGYMRLSRSAKENGTRPAVDPLFRSAARAYGPRVIGVILSGTLDDGTSGLQTVKRQGGIAVVQSPEDALFAGMPASALDNVEVDYCLPLAEIPAVLTRLVGTAADAKGSDAVTDAIEPAPEGEERPGAFTKSDKQSGRPSVYTCPECHGTLWETTDGQVAHFRCRTGHQFSPESLLDSQAEALESALWGAMRALEEKASLARRLSTRATQRDHALAATRFEEQAEQTERSIEIIRSLLTAGPASETGDASEAG